MKWMSRMFSIAAAGLLAGVLVLPSPAQAQARANSWEFILPVTYSPSMTVTGEGGSSANVNSDLGFGFGFGYNPSNHLQVNGLFTWGYRNFDATIVESTPNPSTTYKRTGTLETSTIMLNAIYFFMPQGVTPFVSGGIGSTFVDTNIPTGPTTGTCWYDPYWGYICDTYTPTKSQTAVSYSAGVGVRIPVNRAFSVQGSYNRLWIDASNSKPEVDGWKLEFVFRM